MPILTFTANESRHATSSEKERKAKREQRFQTRFEVGYTTPTPESTPHTSTTESAKTSPTLDLVVHNKAPVMTSPHTSGVGLAKMSPTLNSSVLTSSTPSPAGTSSGESDPELWYISKYLVQIISNATLKSSTSAAKQVSAARVLTNAKCAAILEEREEKKR